MTQLWNQKKNDNTETILLKSQNLNSDEIHENSSSPLTNSLSNPEPTKHLSKFCGVWRAKHSTLSLRRPNGEKCRILILNIRHTSHGVEIIEHLATSDIKSGKSKYFKIVRTFDNVSNQLKESLYGRAIVSNSLREVSEDVGQLRTIYEVVNGDGYVGVEANSTVKEVLEVSAWNKKGLTYSVKMEKSRQKSPVCFGKLYSEKSGIVYLKRLKDSYSTYLPE